MEHNYQIGRVLGRGSFATVHLARRRTNNNNNNNTTAHCQSVVALKLVNANGSSSRNGDREEWMRLLRNEIAVHSFVSSKRRRHVNVVQFMESFSCNDDATVAMALEYCEGGDLSRFFARVRRIKFKSVAATTTSSSEALQDNNAKATFLSTDEIRHGTSQILSGLSHLHSWGIVHRDIKGGNIYLVPRQPPSPPPQPPHDGDTIAVRDLSPLLTLTNYTLKIGDFGLSVRKNETDDWDECQTTVCGTPSCLAPEVLRHGCRSDIDDPIDTNNDDLQHSFDDVVASRRERRYGQPADLWSAGCLLYTMIVGRPPFALPRHERPTNQTERIAATIEKVTRDDWSLPSNLCLSRNRSSSSDSHMKGLLHQLLESRPRKRGSARGILEFHPFFNEIRVGCSGGSFKAAYHDKENVANTEVIDTDGNNGSMPSEHCKSTHCRNNTASGRLTEVHTKRDLAPILMEGLQRLQSNKYKWNHGSKQFAVFLLGYDGLVVQATINDTGHWMHITCDGERVLYREISKRDSHITSNQCSDPALREAFEHAPSSFMCLRKSKPNHDGHMHLNSLLHPSRKPYLRLYRIVQRLIQTLKSTTPKIILYLFSSSSSSSESDTYRLFAKVMSMENGPKADVEAIFVDGTSFFFRKMNRNNVQVVIQWEQEASAHEWTANVSSDGVLTCSLEDLGKLKNDGLLDDVAVERLKHQFLMAQSALIECRRMEERDCQEEASYYPFSVRMFAASSDRRHWVMMDESDVSRSP